MSWLIFLTVQVLFWLGFVAGYSCGKDDAKEQSHVQ
jgi:hypothetical protein